MGQLGIGTTCIKEEGRRDTLRPVVAFSGRAPQRITECLRSGS
jgi:hypothetical protein